MAMALELPAQARAQRGGFPTSARKLGHWLAQVTALDRRECARRLHEGLHSLNRTELPARRRLRLMEQLLPAVRAAHDQLAGRVQSQSLPLPERARRFHELDVNLLDEAAVGYELLLAAADARQQTRRIAFAAERALALRGERLLRAAHVYSSVPEAFWRSVNAAYATAEQAQTVDRPVKDQPLCRRQNQRQTVRGMYKRILLFALAGTQGLRRGEADRIYRALETWHADSVFGPDEGLAGSTYAFAVDLEQAIPPCLPGALPVDPASRIRMLGLDGLVARIERLHGEAPPSDSPLRDDDEVDSAALQRLLDSWRPAQQGRSERALRGEAVDAELGLSVIQARLAAERAPPEERPRRRVDTPGAALTLQTIDTGGPETPAEAVPPRVERGQDRSAPYQAARRAEARLDGDGNRPENPRWLLQDVSTTGYRLCWDGDGSSRAGVGELVALRVAATEDNDQRWSLGVIRRMQFLGERRFEIGVQGLSARAKPARLRREPANPNRKRDRASETSEPALMLPGGGADRSPTLLVPAHMFRQGETLELEVDNRLLRIRLGEVQENSGAFCQYGLTGAPARGRHARADDPLVQPATDHDAGL